MHPEDDSLESLSCGQLGVDVDLLGGDVEGEPGVSAGQSSLQLGLARDLGVLHHVHQPVVYVGGTHHALPGEGDVVGGAYDGLPPRLIRLVQLAEHERLREVGRLGEEARHDQSREAGGLRVRLRREPEPSGETPSAEERGGADHPEEEQEREQSHPDDCG